MHHFQFLQIFIENAAQNHLLFSLAIILCVFVIEDATTVIVGLLAAAGIISVPLALFSLYAGIIFGDIVLYGIGWLASTHPRLARYVDHDMAIPFRAWLETRYVATIFTARFVPFGRFPTYTTSGFFRSPLGIFILVVTAGALTWSTLLFGASYWFGSLTTEWIGSVRWGVALFFLLLLTSIAHRNIGAYRAKRDELLHVNKTH